MSRHFQKQPVMVVHEATTLISRFDHENDNNDNISKRGFSRNNIRKKSQNNMENAAVPKAYRSPVNTPNINHGIANVNSNSALSKVRNIFDMMK